MNEAPFTALQHLRADVRMKERRIDELKTSLAAERQRKAEFLQSIYGDGFKVGLFTGLVTAVLFVFFYILLTA